MYELLTSSRPFIGTSHEVIGQILLLDPEPPSAVRPGINPVLETACLKALAKDPRQRFATMKEFAAAVDGYLRQPGIPVAETAKAVETKSDPDADADEGLSTNTRKLAEVFDAISENRKAAKAETAEAVEEAVSRHGTQTRKFLYAGGAVLVLVILAIGAAFYFTKKDNPTNTVSVNVTLQYIDLSDATLTFILDGKPVTAAALKEKVELTIGDHNLVASRDGAEVKRVRFTVAADGAIKDEKLVMADPVPPGKSGSDGWKGLELVKTLKHKGGVWDARFSADGSQLLTTLPVALDGKDGREGAGVYAWDVKTWEPIGKPVEYSNAGKVAFVGGKVVIGIHGAAGSFGQVPSQFVVWNPANRAQETKFPFNACGAVRALEAMPDGKSFLTSVTFGDEPQVAVFDLATGETRLKMLASAGCIPNDKDGKTILIGSGAEIRQINIATEKVIRTLKGHTEGTIQFVTCSPDGRFAASCASGKVSELVLWDMTAPNGAPVVLGKYKASITSLAFSPNSKSLASISSEGILKLWDVVKREEVASIRADEKQVFSVRFSPDGTHVVAGCQEDKAAKVWKLTK